MKPALPPKIHSNVVCDSETSVFKSSKFLNLFFCIVSECVHPLRMAPVTGKGRVLAAAVLVSKKHSKDSKVVLVE